jgi:hypothetical protein
MTQCLTSPFLGLEVMTAGIARHDLLPPSVTWSQSPQAAPGTTQDQKIPERVYEFANLRHPIR